MSLFMVDIETAASKERYDDYLVRRQAWTNSLRPAKNADERRAMFDTAPKMPHGDDPARDRIVTIQFQKLSDLQPGEVSPLVILKEWEHPNGERGILTKFSELTGMFRHKWSAVPCGFNLSFEEEWLRYKGEAFGLLPWGKARDWEMPRVDLMHTVMLFNADAQRPIDAKGNIPNLFYGASLDRFSRKVGKGARITELYHQKRYAAIEDYIVQESAAFVELWSALVDNMPKFWRSTIAPLVGRA